MTVITDFTTFQTYLSPRAKNSSHDFSTFSHFSAFLRHKKMFNRKFPGITKKSLTVLCCKKHVLLYTTRMQKCIGLSFFRMEQKIPEKISDFDVLSCHSDEVIKSWILVKIIFEKKKESFNNNNNNNNIIVRTRTPTAIHTTTLITATLSFNKHLTNFTTTLL